MYGWVNKVCFQVRRRRDSPVQHHTKKVSSNYGGEDCSIFYLEVTGEAVLIRKTVVGETEFLHSKARVFRDKSLSNRDRDLSGISPL